MNPFAYQLRQLAKFLKDAGVDYAVLGGIAVSVYSEPRMTQDIDLNIIMDIKDLSVFLKKSREYGFLPIPLDITRFVKETGVIPMKFSKSGVIGRFDFIIAQNPIEFAGIKRASFKKIYNVNVKLVTAEDLLLHKLLSERPRDREDVRGIIVRQGKKLNQEYVASWLKKIDKLLIKRRLLKEFNELIKSVGSFET